MMLMMMMMRMRMRTRIRMLVVLMCPGHRRHRHEATHRCALRRAREGERSGRMVVVMGETDADDDSEEGEYDLHHE
jgi:hypothetical protein